MSTGALAARRVWAVRHLVCIVWCALVGRPRTITVQPALAHGQDRHPVLSQTIAEAAAWKKNKDHHIDLCPTVRACTLVAMPNELPAFLNDKNDLPGTRAWLEKLWALRYIPPMQ